MNRFTESATKGALVCTRLVGWNPDANRSQFGNHWDQFEVHVVAGRNIARAMETVTAKDRRLRPFLRRHHAELEPFIGQGRIDWTPVRLLGPVCI